MSALRRNLPWLGFWLWMVALLGLPAHSWAQHYPVAVGTAVTRTLPYAYTGRISVTKGYTDYIGSGTVLKAKSVLTCAHILWSKSAGFATNVYFERALSGSSSLSLTYASSKIILGGYTA